VNSCAGRVRVHVCQAVEPQHDFPLKFIIVPLQKLGLLFLCLQYLCACVRAAQTRATKVRAAGGQVNSDTHRRDSSMAALSCTHWVA
jgi:hypothetical protein